jgi:formate-nitrite transporter family protein
MPDKPQGLTHGERQDVEELSAPRSPVIYEVVRQQGEDELRRPDGSLFWSGIAAGLTIMASVIAQGALRQKLPDAPWREAVSSLGYSVGFLMVILGRMQLFTEQTIVTVLPVMADLAGPDCGPRRVSGSSFS